MPRRLRPLPAWTENASPKPDRTWRIAIGGGFRPVWTINGKTFNPARSDAFPQLGTTETWEIVNRTAVPHMMHMHHTDWYLLSSNGRPPPPWEDCLKETFFLRPGERIKVAGHFADYLGQVRDPLPHARSRGSWSDEPVRGRSPWRPRGLRWSPTHGDSSGDTGRRGSDRELAVLEGFHALKHALRFGAEVEEALTADLAELERLAADLAPDLAEALPGRVTPVDAETIAQLVPQAPRTGVVAIARRPRVDVAALLAADGPAPLVLLEEPRTMGNMGACVRVAAAADAAAVLTTGEQRPLAPGRPARSRRPALRAAGRRRSRRSRTSDRPLVAIDPGGEDLRPGAVPAGAILAFGTERYGLSEALLERADARLGIPMREGVSSLNLATTVAAVLFSQSGLNLGRGLLRKP